MNCFVFFSEHLKFDDLTWQSKFDDLSLLLSQDSTENNKPTLNHWCLPPLLCIPPRPPVIKCANILIQFRTLTLNVQSGTHLVVKFGTVALRNKSAYKRYISCASRKAADFCQDDDHGMV